MADDRINFKRSHINGGVVDVIAKDGASLGSMGYIDGEGNFNIGDKKFSPADLEIIAARSVLVGKLMSDVMKKLTA